MHLIRIGKRFINLERMRYAHISPSGDSIHVYFAANSYDAAVADVFDAEVFTGQEAYRVIDYLTDKCEALIWSEPTDPPALPVSEDIPF